MNKAEYLEALDDMCNEHEPEIQALYDHYGINAPVNPDTLMNALVVHEEPFAEDLYKSIYGETECYEGQQPQTQEDFFTFLGGALETLMGITPRQTQQITPTPNSPAQRIFGVRKNLFVLAGFAVTVVVFIIVINYLSDKA
jgi:hypothetical protein